MLQANMHENTAYILFTVWLCSWRQYEILPYPVFYLCSYRSHLGVSMKIITNNIPRNLKYGYEMPERLLNWSTIKLSLVVITAKGFIMRTIEKTVYKFSELDDKAKDKARESFRYTSEYEADAIIEDFANIAELIVLIWGLA